VFSVRNHAKRALPKTLERALPFASHMNDAGSVVLAVDGTFFFSSLDLIGWLWHLELKLCLLLQTTLARGTYRVAIM
jgi:hypothetical protein